MEKDDMTVLIEAYLALRKMDKIMNGNSSIIYEGRGCLGKIGRLYDIILHCAGKKLMQLEDDARICAIEDILRDENRTAEEKAVLLLEN